MGVKRLFIIVVDGLGIGAMPDADAFGDAATVHTLKSVRAHEACCTPHLDWLGIANIEGACDAPPVGMPIAGGYGRMTEASYGKDTTTGHWEIAGVISKTPMPTFPDGFPPALVRKLEAAFGRKILCNKPYSGTEVIKDFGREHIETGALIVYTSADSVLQIAAHEDVVSREELYTYCRRAREICVGEWGVGRIIARPFIGTYPNYERTSGRHDFSLEPTGETMLDHFRAAGLDTIGVGKISDIFAGRGVGRHIPIDGNDDGMTKTIALLEEDFHGVCFVNLVDTDMQYGHRRDVEGYAKALTSFDVRLGDFIGGMRSDDVLIITADHGCDPGAAGTDHTREYVPVMIAGMELKKGVSLGTRTTFADVAQTAAAMFKLPPMAEGTSFWDDMHW